MFVFRTYGRNLPPFYITAGRRAILSVSRWLIRVASTQQIVVVRLQTHSNDSAEFFESEWMASGLRVSAAITAFCYYLYFLSLLLLFLLLPINTTITIFLLLSLLSSNTATLSHVC